MTFAEDIERAAKGEQIEGAVIGAFGWNDYEDDKAAGVGPREVPSDKFGVLLPWSEARPLLDYAYDDSFGSPDCHSVWAWTPSLVLFVGEYDGATRVEAAPRNPTADIEPHNI